MPNFTAIALKMWPYGPQNRQNLYFFGINLPKRGIFWLREGAPGLHPRVKFHRYSFKNVALRFQKSPKMVIFGKNLPIEKIMRSIGKLEHRCTTTNLPLCNDAIVILKIILLHSVSVITNFVIPKRDKKNRQTKNITLFRLQPARDPSPPYLAW